MKTKPNTETAAPVVDVATVNAVIAATKSAEKTAALKKAGRVTEPRLYVPVGGLVGRRYPQSWRTKDSEQPHLPGAPCIWPNEGQLIEQGVGDHPLEATNNGDEWFREATPDELADPELASDHTAAEFLKASLPVEGAKKFRDAVAAGNAKTRKEIEATKRKLAELEDDGVQGDALLKTADKNIAVAEEGAAAFVESTGKSLAAITRAVEFLKRPALPVEGYPAQAVVPAHPSDGGGVRVQAASSK